MRLEDLQPRYAVRGVHPDGPVTVVSVQWFGSEEAIELTYKTPAGTVAVGVWQALPGRPREVRRGIDELVERLSPFQVVELRLNRHPRAAEDRHAPRDFRVRYGRPRAHQPYDQDTLSIFSACRRRFSIRSTCFARSGAMSPRCTAANRKCA